MRFLLQTFTKKWIYDDEKMYGYAYVLYCKLYIWNNLLNGFILIKRSIKFETGKILSLKIQHY